MINISRIASEQLVEQAQRAKRVDDDKLQRVGRTAWAREDDAKRWEGGKPAVSCIEFDAKTYVGLATDEAVLAVYRVTQDGGLRRLRPTRRSRFARACSAKGLAMRQPTRTHRSDRSGTRRA